MKSRFFRHLIKRWEQLARVRGWERPDTFVLSDTEDLVSAPCSRKTDTPEERDLTISNKSGTSNQVISLPKGGGTLQGIWEKFSPDLYTGTGNFTVPVTLPTGRDGFQPQLNLA